MVSPSYRTPRRAADLHPYVSAPGHPFNAGSAARLGAPTDHRTVESASERRQRKVRWFDRGAQALRCVVAEPLPTDLPVYCCPLCLGGFVREQLEAGVLTDEHVPPLSVGGRPLVLTCTSCNNLASGRLDVAVANEEKVRTFGKPHALGSLPATATRRGIPNTGSVRFDGETVVMMGDAGQNNPTTLAAYTEALKGIGDGDEIGVKIRVGRDPIAAGIGWLRSAYLAAFAVYGYRYTLQPMFDPVRGAIADSTNGWKPPILQTSDEGPLDPLIAEVRAPTALVGCRAVACGPYLIVLPPWGASTDWFETLPDRVLGTGADSLQLASVIGKRFPTEPMHLTDG